MGWSIPRVTLAGLAVGGCVLAGCRGRQAAAPAPSATPPPPTATQAATAAPTATRTPSPEPTTAPTQTPGATEASEAVPPLPTIGLDVLTSTLDGGWVLYQLPEDGFSVSLPPDWMAVDVGPDGLGAIMALAGEGSPELGALLGGHSMSDMLAEGLMFLALDRGAASLDLGMPATVNVLAMETGISLPLDMIVPLTLGRLEEIALADEPIVSERINLNGVEAEIVRYIGDLSSAAGDPLLVDLRQLLVPHGGRLFVVSSSAPTGLDDAHSGLLDQILTSFRVLD